MKVIDFTDKLSFRALKGTKCDPDESFMVDVYTRSVSKFRKQAFKRMSLVGKKISYLGVDGNKHIGEILGFDEATGNPIIKGVSPPAEGSNEIILVE